MSPWLFLLTQRPHSKHNLQDGKRWHLTQQPAFTCRNNPCLCTASSHTISGVEDDDKSVPALSALALASSPSSFLWQGRKFSQLASGQGKPGSEQLLNIKALGPVSTWLAGKLKSYIHGSVVPSTLHSILHQLPLASVHPRKTCLLFFKE